MEMVMFAVGSLIFIAYMFGLLTMINRSHKEQEKQHPTTKADSMDIDGMGDFSRFPATTKKMDVRKKRKNISRKVYVKQ